MIRLFVGFVLVATAVIWLRTPREQTRVTHAATAPIVDTRMRPASVEPSSLPKPRPVEIAETIPEPHSQLDWRRLPLMGSLAPSSQWPGWRCADIDDPDRRASLWVREDSPEELPELHDGTCAEWANRGNEARDYRPEDEDFEYYDPQPLAQEDQDIHGIPISITQRDTIGPIARTVTQ